MGTHDSLPHWLATLDPDSLAELMARRPDTFAVAPDSLVELADRLGSGRSVQLAVGDFNRLLAEVLAAAQAVPVRPVSVDAVVGRFAAPPDRAVVADALDQLVRLGLVWPVDGGFELVPALHVNRARGGRLAALHVEPPAPEVADVEPDAVDRVAGVAALPAVRAMAELIELCSAAPLDVLRSGGVGVKELRRVAKALSVDETLARLWLTIGYHADLLDNDDGSIMPTELADEWLAGTPTERLVPLLKTWWRLPATPTATDVNGKRPAALLHAPDDADRELRHDLIGWFARGRVLLHGNELAELAAWWKPYVYGDRDTDAILHEAEALGVLAGGALSSWGHALAHDDDIEAAVEAWLPAPTGSARLLADLTAVVTGTPTPELGSLLDLAADAGERDTASTWRFSRDSVRRALDAGQTADMLLAALTEASGNDVPQPLTYLIRDVERRHGELTVAEVGCCLLADDATLLTEVAAHRGLGTLALRLLAPGVLASAKPAGPTLELLRANGFAPVAVDGHGTPVLHRITPLRARRRASVAPRFTVTRRYEPEPPLDLYEIAKSLLAAGVTEPEPRESAAVRRHGGQLSDQEISLLIDALQHETPVEITYLDSNDRGSRRVITPLDFDGDRIEAWCHLRDDERHFLISRIRRVAPATA